MGSQVLYDNPATAIGLTDVTFLNTPSDPATTGVPTDPTTVTVVLTDPTGAITNYTYVPAQSGFGKIVKQATGKYSLAVDGLTVPGLYTYTWVGTGNSVQQVTAGTFRMIPLGDVGYGMKYWYTGMEEFKSRIGLKPGDKNYSAFDYEMQLSIHTVANWINKYVGRHFYQLTETRTYAPYSIMELSIDDLAPSKASATLVNLDYNGDGVYDTAWGNPASPVGTGTFYQLKTGAPENWMGNWNPNAGGGVAQPYNQLQALMVPGATSTSGAWLPFVWPYSYLNRVQIIGTWGWDYVPPEVQQASMMLVTDIYKAKDTPWGMAGTPETGMIKVSSNPWVAELLRPYINIRRKAGV